jgi:hypothetical protein
VFVDEFFCMIPRRLAFLGLGGLVSFELTNDDSGDCLLVVSFFGLEMVFYRFWFSMESLILAQDERWRRA